MLWTKAFVTVSFPLCVLTIPGPGAQIHRDTASCRCHNSKVAITNDDTVEFHEHEMAPLFLPHVVCSHPRRRSVSKVELFVQ